MIYLFFIKRKTAYDMRISYWSSDVCSSDLEMKRHAGAFALQSDTAARRHCGFLLAQRDRVGYGFAIQAEQHIAGTQAGMVGRAARMHANDDDAATVDAKWREALHVLHAEPAAYDTAQIGRASCRERVCQYVYISVVAVALKKKITYVRYELDRTIHNKTK